jgi:hypothetical protein
MASNVLTANLLLFRDSVHYLNNCDCDAVLRMKCIANHWEFPTILLGRYFSRSKVQCAALMTKSKVTQAVFIYFFEMSTQELSDLQSRMCEIVVHMIKLFGRLPPMHLVIRSAGDTAEISEYMLFFYFIVKSHSMPNKQKK